MSRASRARGWAACLWLAAGVWLMPLPAGHAAGDSQTRLDTFDAAWRAVTESYYDTTFAGMNWDSLGAAYREQVREAPDDQTVRAVIREMIARLGDSHFALLSAPPLSGDGALHWERVRSPLGLTVGWIRFDVWVLGTSRALDTAMDSLRTADGVIVDLRGNPGGLIPMLIGASGHFLDTPETLGTLTTRNNRIEIRANPRRIDTAGEYVEPYAGPLVVLVDAGSPPRGRLWEPPIPCCPTGMCWSTRCRILCRPAGCGWKAVGWNPTCPGGKILWPPAWV